MQAFSETEERKVSALVTLGLTRIEARLTVYLAMGHDKINSRTVEIEANLRQPEVSIAMTRMRKRGYMGETYQGGSYVGGFYLTKSLNDIATHLYKERWTPLVEALAVIGDEFTGNCEVSLCQIDG